MTDVKRQKLRRKLLDPLGQQDNEGAKARANTNARTDWGLCLSVSFVSFDLSRQLAFNVSFQRQRQLRLSPSGHSVRKQKVSGVRRHSSTSHKESSGCKAGRETETSCDMQKTGQRMMRDIEPEKGNECKTQKRGCCPARAACDQSPGW